MVAHTIREVRSHIHAARATGRTVGLVPTMGALHAGHRALMQATGAACDEVVVSLFVNPTQFDDPTDFASYPRVEGDDVAVARSAGAGLLFAPSREEMYPAGFATSVSVDGLTEVLEGAHRPGHFAGVCTVVTKLLSIVAPDVAFFGRKDAQQLLVIRRMVRDLDLPVRIEALPTVREPDGLALSSRNRRLSVDERRRALALPRALTTAERALEEGERDTARIRRLALESAGEEIAFEYLVVIDPATLAPVGEVAGEVLVVAAARVGEVRLIDNVSFSPFPRSPRRATPAQEAS
jgi:pantoate--beta-alanine ligase